LQKKLELCAQKIFEAFLAYNNQQKASFCHSQEKAAREYVDEIDALMETLDEAGSDRLSL
jgi:hypothetical protein